MLSLGVPHVDAVDGICSYSQSSEGLTEWPFTMVPSRCWPAGSSGRASTGVPRAGLSAWLGRPAGMAPEFQVTVS